MKAAAAVLGASMLFFLGVLTGVGRREAVPPPTAIPLGVLNTPAATGTSRPTSPADAPKRSTTTTVATVPAPTSPSSTAGPTDTTGATATTATTTTTASTAPSSTTTTAPSGEVEQVDNQVDCRSDRRQGKGKSEPCPSTTTSTGGAPGVSGNG